VLALPDNFLTTVQKAEHHCHHLQEIAIALSQTAHGLPTRHPFSRHLGGPGVTRQWGGERVHIVLGCRDAFGFLEFHFHSFQESKETFPVFRSAN
jgi:hypothetical protein